MLDSPSRPSKVARVAPAGQTCAVVIPACAVVVVPPADPATPTAPTPSTAVPDAVPAATPAPVLAPATAAPAAVGAFRDETCGMELEMDWDW